MRIEIKAEAEEDLRDIARFIAKDNPPRAISYVRELRAKILTLGESAMIHPARDEWGVSVRSALHGKYVVIFKVVDEVVSVLRVIHGARDIDSLF